MEILAPSAAPHATVSSKSSVEAAATTPVTASAPIDLRYAQLPHRLYALTTSTTMIQVGDLQISAPAQVQLGEQRREVLQEPVAYVAPYAKPRE